MNNLRNRVQLIGHVGVDPEVIEFDGGKNLAKFRLATNDFYIKSNGDKVEDTQWHNIVTFGKTAEIASKYLKKGREIAIEGRISNRKYEDKEGNTKYFTEIIANDFIFLGKKGE